MPEPDANLYAPPAADLELSPREARDCWRQGMLLIVERSFTGGVPCATCVKCAKPAVASIRRRCGDPTKLRWVYRHPLHPMTLRFGFCRRHRAQFFGTLLLGAVLVLSGLGMLIAWYAQERGGVPKWPVFALLWAGSVVCSDPGNLYPRIVFMNADLGIFTGCSPAWLEQLPENPS